MFCLKDIPTKFMVVDFIPSEVVLSFDFSGDKHGKKKHGYRCDCTTIFHQINPLNVKMYKKIVLNQNLFTDSYPLLDNEERNVYI